MIVTSIDVGFRGGISRFLVLENKYSLLDIWSMPVYYTEKRKKVKGKTKKVKVPNLDIIQIQQILLDSSIIIIEDVHSMPREGVSSAFRFGLQKGILIGLSCGIVGANNTILVSPQSWKRYFKLSKNKKKSVDLVNKIYGMNLSYRDDGIAEAILIGQYFIETSILKQ